MRKLVFMWVMLFGFSAFAQNTDDLLNKYINAKNALVESDSKAASQAIGTFYQSLKNEQNFVQKHELLKAAEKFSKANNLEKQRALFNDVSTQMWKWVKDSEKADQILPDEKSVLAEQGKGHQKSLLRCVHADLR